MNVLPEHILNCQFSEWYPLYRDVTFKSHVIDLPDHFLLWLKSDGVSLPTNTPTSIFCANDGSDSDDDNGERDISVQPRSEEFDFEELNNHVREAIDSLGGHVFPKTNWSSPQDAAWMNMNSLKCSQAGDVYLLLKSSDFVSHDLYYPFDMCSSPPTPDQSESNTNINQNSLATISNTISFPKVEYKLVLRKWQNLRPERSFRCFLKNRLLVAISQRDCTAFFPQLTVEMEKITEAISMFFASEGRFKKNGSSEENNTDKNSMISHRFPDVNFVADVYVDQSLKVWMVDVNAWSSSTDSLMFAWGESPLHSNFSNSEDVQETSDAAAVGEESQQIETPPIVRIVESEACLRPAAFSEYKAPLEMHQFAQSLNGGGGGGGDSTTGVQQHGSAEGLAEFIAFMAKCEKENK